MALPLALAALVVAGCQSADPMVGTWTTQTSMMGSPGTVEATFGADGSYRSESKFDVAGNTLTMSDTGSWKYVDGKKLKLTLATMDVKLASPNPTMQSMIEGQKDRVIAAFNAAPAGDVKVEGKDKVTLSLGGQAVTFTRKP